MQCDTKCHEEKCNRIAYNIWWNACKYTVHKMYTLQCTIHNMYTTHHTHYTIYNVQCAMHSVQFICISNLELQLTRNCRYIQHNTI